MLRSFMEFFNAYDHYHLHGIPRNPLRTGLLAELMHKMQFYGGIDE
ncbi:hypothetical protein ACNKHK_26640 [Shigella flexneri]